MSDDTEHYLRRELMQLMRTDPRIFDFLENGSLDGTWYWDLENPDHEWMSDRLWEVFGYGPNEKPHLASAWQDMINPDDLQLAFKNVQAHCADPEHPYDQVVRYTHKQGHTVWVRCRGMAIRDETGKPVRMLGAHQDVTELKRAEAQLQRNNQELAKANEELRRFAYAASHDIRSPVVTLNALLSRLQERHADALDEEGQKLLDLAQRNAVRMGELAERVLDYARVTRSEAELEDVDIADLVSGILENLAKDLSDAGALVSVGAMPTVRVDRVMLRIALQNLVENALKYNASPEPRIDLSAEVGVDSWSLSVADNGIGISAENRERIFRGFERLHRRDEYSGAGLGLSVCAQVVAMHGGDIHVRENQPSGTVFIVELPMNPEVVK